MAAVYAGSAIKDKVYTAIRGYNPALKEKITVINLILLKIG